MQQSFLHKNFLRGRNCLFCVFFRLKFLSKRFEIVLIASFIILLMCTPLNLPMENYFPIIQHQSFFTNLLIFICMHLFYLSEPILICQNLFLSVRTYFHLCTLVFICENLFLSMIIFDDLFLLMIICENFIFL